MTREVGRRRAPRVATQLKASLTGRNVREVTVLDLSLTGCLVQADWQPDHGAILDLTLGLGDEPWAGKVRVTESSRDGLSEPPRYLAGLAFLGLPPHQEARLRRFLEDRQRRKGADAPAE